LKAIVQQTIEPPEPAGPVLGGDQVLEMVRVARAVPIAAPVLDYAVGLVLATHPGGIGPVGGDTSLPLVPPSGLNAVRTFVRAGASPRALQALVTGAQVRALLDGRFNVSVADVQALAHAALRHRILLNFEGQAEGISADAVVDHILEQVREP
jgi:MoxR-like ATPase